jgi:bifunctional UDP-N-acetylglucosamine pyrophosphorylase / glucosamine-1-phosphate N-acetyltransferase
MAAGLGTRMRSARPKHLHPLVGRRVLDWALLPAQPLGPDPLVVVCSPATRDELARTLPDQAELVVQAEPRGTGDAVAAARPALEDFSGDVLVLDGAAPLLTSEVLEELVAEHRRSDASVTVLSIQPEEPRPYGRVLRDEEGGLRGIVEDDDASPAERAVQELNASI